MSGADIDRSFFLRTLSNRWILTRRKEQLSFGMACVTLCHLKEWIDFQLHLAVCSQLQSNGKSSWQMESLIWEREHVVLLLCCGEEGRTAPALVLAGGLICMLQIKDLELLLKQTQTWAQQTYWSCYDYFYKNNQITSHGLIYSLGFYLAKGRCLFTPTKCWCGFHRKYTLPFFFSTLASKWPSVISLGNVDTVKQARVPLLLRP